MRPMPCWFPRVLNVLTVVSGAALWIYLCNDSLYYYTGSSLREGVAALFVICLFGQFARAIMPMVTRSRGIPRRLTAALGTVVLLGVIIHFEQETFFKRDLPRHRADRISYAGESDAAILRAFTDRNFYYPPESFLEAARSVIPLEDSVLYIGDIRPDPVNYGLYPRRVFAIPALQRATLAAAVRSWSRQADPAFPDGFAKWLEDEPDAAVIEAETQRLVREHAIKWVVYVDSLDESANRVIRIGGGS